MTPAASGSIGTTAGGHGAYIDALAKTGVGMVCVLDRDGRIAVFDDGCERVTGWTAPEVLGRDAREVVIPPDEAEAFSEFLEHVWRHGMSSPQIGHWLTKEGEPRLISWANRPIFDEAGEVAQLFCVGIDLTERERANEELRAVHEELAERLYELEQLAAEQSGLRRVALLVAGEASPAVVFDAVALEVARVVGAEATAIARFDGDGTATFVGRSGPQKAFPPTMRMDLREDSAVSRVWRTGEVVTIERYEDVHGAVAQRMLKHGFGRAAAAPVSVAGRLWGAVVVAAGGDALPAEATERRLLAFAQLVALALASADAREQLHASRKRLVQVADDERRRLERDLHDGAQQRLVALSQRLYLAQRHLGEDHAAAQEQLGVCTTELREAIEDLRRLANGLHPPILTEAGLRPALRALVRRSTLPVELRHFPDDRFPAEVETAAYYLVSEALTNTAKHAQATGAAVDVGVEWGRLVVQVTDDGLGGASPEKGTGLRGLVDRVEAVGGTLQITSRPTGTMLRAEFPLGS